MSEQWIVGINAVSEALKYDARNLAEVLIEQRAKNPRLAEIATAAKAAGVAVRQAAPDALARAAGGARHQGVVAQVAMTRNLGEGDLDELLGRCEKPLLLILDGVQDPHNLGACLRSAEAAGVDAVIVPRDRAVGITPVVRKIASGAADRVPLIRVTNLARTMKTLQEAGVWIVGLAGEAEQSLYQVDLSGPIAIAMGGEGDGLRRLSREHCDYLAKIPMRGQVESLNVSVATGVAVFEALRQRGG
ncbi:23S rRNA (guanosine(2251)-2'-O)-methyltransferase RlmB [Pseudomarimonas salicorniae]|uniref:23S rRNA (guanosine-2'-O-)-methyltransferase RlmB n=1 Tax=Pseudomarimonas salicorniae TaxID=2933270 RepID=A0ABT0GJV1_9GAMM|nr:23S rRNA (guanosine(2251)-2'-O)-methyltransferase RlmB [Lysobacter sp. CAU 1642]MCK7594829.1 23S rRNA (guanosine(2251)-2'-O)-methyltransferase RlmB [Lysobacter sp. CAU 1642]